MGCENFGQFSSCFRISLSCIIIDKLVFDLPFNNVHNTLSVLRNKSFHNKRYLKGWTMTSGHTSCLFFSLVIHLGLWFVLQEFCYRNKNRKTRINLIESYLANIIYNYPLTHPSLYLLLTLFFLPEQSLSLILLTFLICIYSITET